MASLFKNFWNARGSAKDIGRSVGQANDKKAGRARDEESAQQAEAAAAAAAALAASESALDIQKESQRKGMNRKGRRASILTTPQGAPDPLGLP